MLYNIRNPLRKDHQLTIASLPAAYPVTTLSTATLTVCLTYDPGGNPSLSSLSW